jgi:hypothetical protein
LKYRKNFYHNVQGLHWENDFKDTPANYLGLIPKNIEDVEGEIIGKLTKIEKIEEWVKPYNEKGVGVYLYLTSVEKT